LAAEFFHTLLPAGEAHHILAGRGDEGQAVSACRFILHHKSKAVGIDGSLLSNPRGAVSKKEEGRPSRLRVNVVGSTSRGLMEQAERSPGEN
jgi:hypothetical protein